MSPCMKSRDPNWTDWCEGYARKVACARVKVLCKIHGISYANKDTFSRANFGSDATSRSGTDAEDTVDSSASMHLMSKVDLTLEEQETITVSNKTTTVTTAVGTIRTTSGDRLRDGSGHVRYCPTSQRFSSRMKSWKTLRRTWVFVWMERRQITKPN